MDERSRAGDKSIAVRALSWPGRRPVHVPTAARGPIQRLPRDYRAFKSSIAVRRTERS